MQGLVLPRLRKEVKEAFHIKLVAWYRQHRRLLPWRIHPTPYAVTVCELMCQQTQIKTVLPYYERWMRRWPNWQELAQAGEAEVLKLWEGLGYYRRARALHALAQAVVELPTQELPPDVEDLKKLPGIGPYTAGAIASIAFGQKAHLLDGNVERVLARVFNLRWNMATPQARRLLTQLTQQLLPDQNWGDYNQALMECGSQICTPRKPLCVLCPLQAACIAQEPEKLPVKTRTPTDIEHETLGWIYKDKRLWLTLPQNPRRWKGFYRLPSIPKPGNHAPLLSHTYGITKYKVTADLVLASTLPRETPGRWFELEELQSIFLPAPHRKMIEQALEMRNSCT